MLIGIDASRAEAKIKTGVERYSFELLRAMRASLPPQTEVVLYSRAPLSSELGPFNDKWKNKVLNWPPKYLWTQLRLSWEMIMHAPDVLFVPSHELPRIIPKKTVKTVHDAFFMDFPKLFPLGERLFLKATLFDATHCASSIIVPSNYVASQIKRWRTKNVFVVPHGIRLAAPATMSSRRYAGNQNNDGVLDPVVQRGDKKEINVSDEKYFVVLGRIEKKKNLTVVIDAFSEFVKAHPDYKLYFIGRFANGAQEIVEHAQKSSAAKNIEFMGAIPDEEMYATVKGAVALLHPCPYEGFGFPGLEAMKLGVPVVVANQGAIAEAVGDAGLQVAPDDAHKWAEAMNQITFDIFRHTLIEKGERRVNELTWPKSAALTWKVLLS